MNLMVFQEFQDSRHGYRNRTKSTILNLHNILMPPIKFQLKTTSGLELTFEGFQVAAMAAILDIGSERF